MLFLKLPFHKLSFNKSNVNMSKLNNLFLWTIFLYLLICQYVCSKKAYLLKKPQCTTANHQKINLLISKLMTIGPNGRKMPENEQQLRTFCQDTKQMLRQVENFMKDCFKSPVKEYSTVSIYTVRINLRKVCGGKNKMVKEIIKLAPCANKYIIHNDSCVKGFEKRTKNLIYLENDKAKFLHICWYVFHAKKLLFY